MRHGFSIPARARNTSIFRACGRQKSFEIRSCERSFTSAFLRTLATNTNLETLTLRSEFRNSLDDDCFSSVGRLLETKTSVQRFELVFHGRMNGEQFGPIAQGLIKSSSVCGFKLSSAQPDDVAIRGLQKVLEDKPNLASLSLEDVTFGANNQTGQQVVLESLATALTRPKSSLRCLEYEATYSDYVWMAATVSLCSEQLQRASFRIGSLVSHLQLQALTSIVPSMRIGRAGDTHTSAATFRRGCEAGYFWRCQEEFQSALCQGLRLVVWSSTQADPGIQSRDRRAKTGVLLQPQ